MAIMFGDGHEKALPCDGDVGDIMIKIIMITINII